MFLAFCTIVANSLSSSKTSAVLRKKSVCTGKGATFPGYVDPLVTPFNVDS
jgi:hypothetical protein